MNEYLSKLIELGKMVGGKISFDQGFVFFQRLNKEELEKIPEEERAYATTAMGRAIFQLGENGKIINYKGVDSHLDNSEAGLMQKVGAVAVNYTRGNEDYVNSSYPLNLVLFLNQGPDIRIRGASPLEDLEIEADINSRMQGKGIKLPKIKSVREFPEDLLKKLGLPEYVDGSFSEFTSDYEAEDVARKSYLKAIMQDRYKENQIQGKRPETVAEYLRRIDVTSNPIVQEFLTQKGLTTEDFSNYVDKTYSRGQRYGQAEREIESPFRIADFEILLSDPKNLPAIEAMVGFTESMHPDRVPFENYYAKQLGINLGNMMNNGWECENFSHRQDYCITGEMCDDSYEYAPRELELLSKYDSTQPGRANAGRTNIRLKYFTQIYLLSSNIKVLQDEMKMRGKTQEEIDSVLTDFLDNFKETVDLEKASLKISDRPETARQALEIFARTPKDIAELLGFEPKGPDKPSVNDEVIRTQTPFNSFFDEVSKGLAERFEINRSFINETPQDINGVNPYRDFGGENR